MLKQQLLDIARLKTNLKGAVPHNCFGNINGVIYFLNGIQTFSYTPTESSNMVGMIYGTGDWIGALSIGDEYKLFVLSEELEPIRILYFPSKEIEHLAAEDPNVYKWLFFAAKGAQRIWASASAVTQHDKVTRAAYAIMEMAIRQEKSNANKLTVKVSQQQLSDLSGISRSRLNEVLKSFENEGAITLSRGSIQINDQSKLSDKLKPLYSTFQINQRKKR